MVGVEADCVFAAVAFARPKSISFAPLFVSMMLPGLRSRWVTPVLCALSSPSQISIPYFRTCSSGSGPFLSDQPASHLPETP